MAIKNINNFKDLESLKTEIQETKQTLLELEKTHSNNKCYIALFYVCFMSNFVDYFEKAKQIKDFSASKAITKVIDLLDELSPLNPDFLTAKASAPEAVTIQREIDHFTSLLEPFQLFIYDNKETIKEEAINQITYLLNDDYYHYRYPDNDTDPFTYNYNWLWTDFKEIAKIHSIITE